jgi:hypothetical protein
MRCQCCNRNLSDYESALRHPVTMEYLDICTKCLQDIPIEPIEPINSVNDVGYEDDPEDVVNDILLEDAFYVNSETDDV